MERLPTPVLWPGEFHGLYSPWGRKESDTTEWLSLSLSPSQGPPLSPPLGDFKALGQVLLPIKRGSAPKLIYGSHRSLCIDDFDLKWLLIGRISEAGNFLLIDFVTCPVEGHVTNDTWRGPSKWGHSKGSCMPWSWGAQCLRTGQANSPELFSATPDNTAPHWTMRVQVSAPDGLMQATVVHPRQWAGLSKPGNETEKRAACESWQHF